VSNASSSDSVNGRHNWQRTSTIGLKVEQAQLNPLLDYIINVLEKNTYLSQLSKSSIEGGAVLQYRLTSKEGEILDVAIKFLQDKIYIYYAPYPPGSMSEKDYISLDMETETIIRSYFSDQSKASLFLVFSPKMNMLPRSKERGIKKLLASVIFGNMLYFFVLTMLVALFLYQFLLEYTPIVLVLIPFVIILFANKLLAARGEFEITADNPSIHIAELRMKRNEFDQVIKSCLPKISEVKTKIYESTLALGQELNQETIVKTLNEYGSVCTPEFVKIKTVNVYNIIKELTDKFRFKVPQITLINVLPPNAAATGISPSRATVMVTSGLIASMDDDEIKTVIAHEFSHVRARDPLVLLGLATLEYLSRVYIFFPFFATFGFLVDIAYLIFSFTLLFFVAKFLEARADLDAAVKTRQPKALASSLRKLGLWKYQSSVFELVNSGEWIKWDPHPPLYYRIRTLESLDLSKINHTYWTAIKGCIKGFIASLSGK